MSIFSNYGEKENFGEKRGTRRQSDADERLRWLYGSAEGRKADQKGDLDAWRNLGRRKSKTP